jgi:transcription elongation factor GreB
MSKAFVKDDSGTTDLDDELDANFAADSDDEDESDGDADDASGGGVRIRNSKNYITVDGLKRLKDELHFLLTVDRPKVVEVVAWAAGNGDRSENADYQYGKRRLREIDRRVRFLQKRIDIAEVVDPVMQKGSKVLFGATVVVRDEQEVERTYRIVGIDETDAKLGKISWVSPIGRALLQSTEGDVVTLKTPRGEEDLEIVSVTYKPIE